MQKYTIRDFCISTNDFIIVTDTFSRFLLTLSELETFSNNIAFFSDDDIWAKPRIVFFRVFFIDVLALLYTFLRAPFMLSYVPYESTICIVSVQMNGNDLSIISDIYLGYIISDIYLGSKSEYKA